MQKLSKNARRTALGASVGVVVVGAAVSVAGLASAAPTPTPTATPSASSSAAPAGPGRDGRGHGPRNSDELAQQLATRLGLDQTKVSTALKEVRAADKPAKPSPKPTPTPGSTPATRDPAAGDATLAKALAPKLGVDEAKIKTALDEIRAARAADRTKALDDRLAAAVTAGTLTQAEADAVKKAADAGVINVGPR